MATVACVGRSRPRMRDRIVIGRLSDEAAKRRVLPLDTLRTHSYIRLVFRRSSAVEQLTVNQLVVGSIPTAGAKNL